MSYVVSIVRYRDNAPPVPINHTEWSHFVASDDSLQFAEPVGPFAAARWTAHPQHKEVWFTLHETGYIQTTSPDDHTLAKAIQVAQALGARVRGEHGEFLDQSPNVPARSGCASVALILLACSAFTALSLSQ
jgi:hypothetical protein